MFGFIKKSFLVGLTVLSYVNPLSTNQLSCIMLIAISLYFILLVLKQVNAVVAVTISMICMQNMCS